MGFLDDLYARVKHPGMIDDRRAEWVVTRASLAPAEFGMRVQIPRWARRLVPYGLDAESGVGEKGYLPAPGQLPRTVALAPPGGGVPPGGTGPGGGGSVPPIIPPVRPGTGSTGQPLPAAPGYDRTFNLHFTADTSGSDPAQEVRVTPSVNYPFKVKQVEITPLAGVTVGQYVDILAVPNADMSDDSVFLGSSVFENPSMLGDIPAPDGQRAQAIPLQTVTLRNLGPVFAAGQQLKVVSFFTSPASALAQFSVSVTVEEFDPSVAQPPPRVPPLAPPPAAQPPTLPPPMPAPPPAAPPVPSSPPGTIPAVPSPSFSIITVVPGYLAVTQWVALYDAAGHTVGWVQDPAQASAWAAIRAQYAAATGGPTVA